MEEKELRQWMEQHPGKCPPNEPEGSIGVIFPGENTKDYALLSGLFQPCHHTARETLQWLLGRIDAEEVPLDELPSSVKRLHEIPEGIPETDCSVFRLLDTEQNRKLYRVTDNHGKPEYIGYWWKKDYFFCSDERLYLEECLYRGVFQKDIEDKTVRFGEFVANLGIYLTEY